MLILPQAVQDLAALFKQLPGIGPRSAERIALHLVQEPPEKVRQLADTLAGAREKISACSLCGALTEQDPCSICTDSKRDPHILCVVETALDVLRIERSGGYGGRYHVLGGKLSPINGVEPEDLRVKELESRIAGEGITEIIVALGTDVEGEATAYYLAQQFQGKVARVSRLAYGIPAGTGIEFADQLTLSRAIAGRQKIE